MSPASGSTATEWVPTGSVTVRVPGKVNLYLGVGDRREDGYHELTTVFHAVSLSDEVLDMLRSAQVNLAAEQARYEIAFRQDLAALAEQVRQARRG